MITEKTVFKVVVSEWIDKVKIGIIKAVYYTTKDKLPEKYKGANTRKIGKKLYYVDENNKRILKNPTKKGLPNYWNINGQAFYSNNMSWKTRSTIVNFYHSYFDKYVREQLKVPFPTFLSYRLDMKLTMYTTYSGHTPDITNMWVLAKMMEDTIVKAGILRDDSPQYRMETAYGYRFVEKEEDRKLVLEFKYNKYE